MEKILGKIYSLDKLLLSDVLLWIYRIGITLIAIIGILKGLSAMPDDFTNALFIIFIITPFSMLVFRIQIELVYILVGIYNKISRLADKLAPEPAKIPEPPANADGKPDDANHGSYAQQ